MTGDMAEENPWRFSTKYWEKSDYSYGDWEAGLYYYGFRFYSPDLGRWINRDPMGEQGGENLYAFVLNNPIDLTDPLGLHPAKYKEWEHPEFNNLPFEVKVEITKAWHKEKKRYEGNSPMLRIFRPTDFSEDKSFNPLTGIYGGIEFHFIAGVGIVGISCCDNEEKARYLIYLKICGGASFGGGLTIGYVQNADGQSCAEPSKKAIGPELGVGVGIVGIEAGYAFDMDKGGVSLSLGGGRGREIKRLPKVGGRFGQKVTLCYYRLLKNLKTKSCCVSTQK